LATKPSSCGWKVTVYANVAAKVAPFYVRMDFLRSTGAEVVSRDPAHYVSFL
jgi:hypothetical protein